MGTTTLVDKNGNPLRSTKAGELFTAKRLPDFASAVMAGKFWEVMDGTTTVALVAKPTTLSNLTIQNPAGSGKWYVVTAIKQYMDVVAGTLGDVAVWHCVHKLAVVPYTRDFGAGATGADVIGGLRAGQGPYSGQIILDRGATVVDDGWTPTPAHTLNSIVTTNFQGVETALNVPVVIPPSFHYSLQTLATVVTYESALGIVWAEFDETDLLDL